MRRCDRAWFLRDRQRIWMSLGFLMPLRILRRIISVLTALALATAAWQAHADAHMVASGAMSPEVYLISSRATDEGIASGAHMDAQCHFVCMPQWAITANILLLDHISSAKVLYLRDLLLAGRTGVPEPHPPKFQICSR